MLDILKEIGLERKIESKKHPFVTVKVIGDLNDADYQTGEAKFDLTDLNEEDGDVVLLKEFIELYKRHKELLFAHYFWLDFNEMRREVKTSLTDDELEEIKDRVGLLLEGAIPTDEYGYCHTLKSVEFFYTDENGNTIELTLI